ncbi:MAG TPA: hypothetical protein VKA27_10280 [Sunxiuqinia sp.]|nr:hypothetical protein [Sunxiuqinia sp.]
MIKLLYLLAVAILLAACHKDDGDLDFSKEELEITSGYVCGWCAGADSIIIANDAFQYIASILARKRRVLLRKAVDPCKKISGMNWFSRWILMTFPPLTSIHVMFV